PGGAVASVGRGAGGPAGRNSGGGGQGGGSRLPGPPGGGGSRSGRVSRVRMARRDPLPAARGRPRVPHPLDLARPGPHSRTGLPSRVSRPDLDWPGLRRERPVVAAARARTGVVPPAGAAGDDPLGRVRIGASQPGGPRTAAAGGGKGGGTNMAGSGLIGGGGPAYPGEGVLPLF